MKRLSALGLCGLVAARAFAADAAAPDAFEFKFANNCIEHSPYLGDKVMQFFNRCQVPITIIFCLATRRDGWLCNSTAHEPGGVVVQPGSFVGLIDTTRRRSDEETRLKSFAVACSPSRTVLAPRVDGPPTPGTVAGDACYEAAHRVHEALKHDADIDPERRLRALGYTVAHPSVK